MNKQISLVINELKQKLIVDINTSNLPPCIAEMILKDIYLEINNVATKQLEIDTQAYEKELAEENNK